MASDFQAETRLLPDLTLCLTSVEWQIARFAPTQHTGQPTIVDGVRRPEMHIRCLWAKRRGT